MKITTIVRTHSADRTKRQADSIESVHLDIREYLDSRIIFRRNHSDPLILLDVKTAREGDRGEADIYLWIEGDILNIGPCLMFFTPSAPGPAFEIAAATKIIPWAKYTEKSGAPATILPRRSQYEKFIRAAGPELAVEILEAINDICALRLNSTKSNKLSGFMHIADLVRYLSIDTEAFISYASLAKTIDSTKSPNTLPPTELKCELSSGQNNRISISFNFNDSELKGSQPSNAIIGSNGAGKTRCLDSLARTTTNSGTYWPRSVLFFSQESINNRKGKLRTKSSLKIVPVKPNWLNATRSLEEISASCINNHFEIEIISRLFDQIIPIDKLFVPINSGAALAPPTQHILRSFDIDYISFKNYLHEITSGNRVLLNHDHPPLISQDGEMAFPPSSGESTIFCLLLSIFKEADSSTLVLIDEPETNLHPFFIAILMKKLRDMLIAKNSLAVIATHSPFVVRELDKSTVSVFRRGRNGNTEILFPTLQTHGANIGDISTYVFDDDHSTPSFQSAIESIALRKSLSRQEMIDMAFENFGADAVNYVLSREPK